MSFKMFLDKKIYHSALILGFQTAFYKKMVGEHTFDDQARYAYTDFGKAGGSTGER